MNKAMKENPRSEVVAIPYDQATDDQTSIPSTSKRIVIVIPGRLFRDGIQRVLQGSGTVIGSYKSLEDVHIDPQDDARPNLFIVGFDQSYAPASFFDRITELRSQLPGSRWILLSRHTGPALVRDAMRAGINDLLLEDSSGEVLQHLVELVMRGHSLVLANLFRFINEQERDASQWPPLDLNPGGAPMVLNDSFDMQTGNDTVALVPHFAATVMPLRPATSADECVPEADARRPFGINAETDFGAGRPVKLSDRENEILRLLVEGQSNKAIARKLLIAEATVKVHVKALLRKMRVQNRTQAAISALNFMSLSAISAEAGADAAKLLDLKSDDIDVIRLAGVAAE